MWYIHGYTMYMIHSVRYPWYIHWHWRRPHASGRVGYSPMIYYYYVPVTAYIMIPYIMTHWHDIGQRYSVTSLRA